MIELISMHIEKTGGTSFRNSLIRVYGESNVLRVDIPVRKDHSLPAHFPKPGAQEAGGPLSSLRNVMNSSSWLSPLARHVDKILPPDPPKVLPSRQAPPPRVIPPSTRVIHGHFRYHALLDYYRLSKDIPLITWMRNPVDRVISHYYYFEKILTEAIEKTDTPRGVLRRMQRSLPEYARADRNRVSMYIDGMSLRDFFFVGILEHMEEDLVDLAHMLGWKEYEMYRHNVTRKRSDPVKPEIREELANCNEIDMALYHEALQLREERCAKMGRHAQCSS